LPKSRQYPGIWLHDPVLIDPEGGIFGQFLFTSGFNDPPTISDALTLILASLALLGLSNFRAGHREGLIDGGPQLGAGAAGRHRSRGSRGIGAVGVGLAGAGVNLRTLQLQQRLRARPRHEDMAIEWREIGTLIPYARQRADAF